MEIPNTANIYLFKVNKRNTRKMCEIWLKLTMKALLNVRLFKRYCKVARNQFGPSFSSCRNSLKRHWERIGYSFIWNYKVVLH